MEARPQYHAVGDSEDKEFGSPRNGMRSSTIASRIMHYPLSRYATFGMILLFFLGLGAGRSGITRSGAQSGSKEGTCTLDEFNVGAWHHRAWPIATVKDVFDLYHNDINPISPRDVMCNWPGISDYQHNLERLLNVSAYDWKPSSGCSLLEYDRTRMLIYLLRAPGGLLIMGDSLSEQHMFSLNNLLIYPNGPVRSSPEHGDGIHSKLYLDIAHPDALRILDAAGVPAERALSPLAVYHHDSLLIVHEDLDSLFREIGTTVATDLPPLGEGQKYQNGIFRLSEWTSTFPRSLIEISEWAAGKLVYPETRDEEKRSDPYWPSGIRKEQAIILVCTGAHWNPHYTGEITEKEVILAYSHMVDRMIPRLLALQPNVLPVWRAVTPGHEECYKNNGPDPRRHQKANPDAKIDPTTGHFKHYWDMIEIHNTAVARAVKKTAGRIVWMDGYSLAAQRPDVHRHPGPEPGTDCLHLCGQVLETQWTKMLWHIMATHSRN